MATALTVQDQLRQSLNQNEQDQQQLATAAAQSQQQLNKLDTDLADREVKIKATQARVESVRCTTSQTACWRGCSGPAASARCSSRPAT
jgi:hypothetical protein